MKTVVNHKILPWREESTDYLGKLEQSGELTPRIGLWRYLKEELRREIVPREIDFWFKTKDVGDIRIQVKSSMKGVEEAKKHHPKIPVVRIPPSSSEDSLFRECLGVVEQERIKYVRERR